MSKNEWLESLINDARNLVLQPTLKGSKASISFDANSYIEECLGGLGTSIDVSDCLNEEVTISADLDLGVAGDVTISIEGTLEDGAYVGLEELVRSVWCGDAPDPTPYIEQNDEKTPIVQTMGLIYGAWKENRKEEPYRRDPLLFALSAMAEVISDVKAETKQRVLDENLPAELRVFRDKETNLKEQISWFQGQVLELEGAAELSELQAKTNQEIIKDQNDRIGRLLSDLESSNKKIRSLMQARTKGGE